VLPQALAAKVVSREIAVAEMNDNLLTIRDRRGAGEIVQVVEFLLAAGRSALGHAGADLASPHDLACRFVDLQQEKLVALLRGDKEGIAPGCRRARSLTRQRTLPRDVLRFRPFPGETGLVAHAVAVGPAPPRPVAGF